MNLLPDSIKEKILSHLHFSFLQSTLLQKLIIILITVAVFFIFSRLNYLGSGLNNLSKRLIPTQIELLDGKIETISLFASFEKIQHQKSVRMNNGGSYKSGDQINIKFTTNNKAWVLAVSKDKAGYHQLFSSGNMQPKPYTPYKDEEYIIDFQLDNTIGLEHLFIFAAPTNFSFHEDLKNNIEKSLSLYKSAKGGNFIHTLDVPEHITYNSISFYHN